MRPFRALRTFVDPSAQGGFHWLHYIALLAIINVGLLLPIASGGRIAAVGPVPLPKAVSPAPHQWLANSGPLAAPITVPPGLSVSPSAAGAWQVHNVVVYWLNASGQVYASEDMSTFINEEGRKYGVSPVFITAVIWTESGFIVNVERWAGGLDNSCGLMQQIVTNIAYHIGDSNARDDCDWEKNPRNSIDFGTQILRDDIAQHGGRVPPPWAYSMYNAGSGYNDSFYLNIPYCVTLGCSQVSINYWGNFYPKWQLTWARYAYSGPPPVPPKPPKPVHHYKFPKRFYEQHRRSHHLKLISPYYHHKLAFAPSVWWTVQNKHGREVLGGILRRERFNRRRQVMTTSYQCGKIFTWPTHHGWPAKVKRHRCSK